MITDLLLLLLPVAAASGWHYARKSAEKSSSIKPGKASLPQDYFVGLNYLINEQPDKAVEVFIKMLEVNSDTVETHLALGSLFRRRGEVDRAIRVHQNLIARPQLAKFQRIQALSELAQDYLRAGVLDRAERLFLELVKMGEQTTSSLQYLLNIYQQQKDWEQAINTAQRLQVITHESMHVCIAHYYCELAEQTYDKKMLDKSKSFLQQALQNDKRCVRASILQAEIETMNGNFKAAIRAYKQVKSQDPDYISEIVLPLARCSEELKAEDELIDYLRVCLDQYPRVPVVLVLADYLRKQQGDRVAIEFLAEQIHLHPSLRCLDYLLQLYLENSIGDTRYKLQILHDLVKSLLAQKPVYRCSECGFAAKTLYWQCPRCRHWNTVKPIHGLEGD